MTAPAQPKTRTLIAIVSVWLAVVIAGLGLLFAHSIQPGATAAPPKQWPADTRLQLDGERHTLVFVGHPQCPCTRASVAELGRLVARLQGQLTTHVLFVRPDEDWERTELWRNATAIAGVDVVADPNGTEAELFGARTSGQVYLFAPSGELLFEGGITPSRAHEGDSVGRDRIVALVTEGVGVGDNSAVYGCALEDEDTADVWVRWMRGL